MSLFDRCTTTTKSMIDAVGDAVGKTNPAWMIYNDLYQNLILYQNFDDYFRNNPDVKQMMDDLVSHVINNEDYISLDGMPKKIRGYNLLGDQLVSKLSPRFKKQKPNDPSKSKELQALEWMNENVNLIYETDRITVQAGFLGIFHV